MAHLALPDEVQTQPSDAPHSAPAVRLAAEAQLVAGAPSGHRGGTRRSRRPLLGDADVALADLLAALGETDIDDQRPELAARWTI